MALTTDQKSSRLFKKSLGAGETLITRDFFEEPKLGKDAILPSQIWAEASKIPTTAPTLGNGEISGVVQYYEKLSLTHVAGSSNASYFHSNLIDTIPFNYSDGSYNYKLYKSDGTTSIAFGEGDWLVDTTAGLLTFYGTLPSSVTSLLPPQISFYRYVGDKGVPSGSTSGLVVKGEVIAATQTGETISNYDYSLSGYTSIPSSVDGVTSFIEGNRILIKNQTDAVQNGLFQVSGTTLVRAIDADGQPEGEVGVNDYTFVTSGISNIASSWVIGSTDAENPDIIYPGVNTQNWILFARSAAYITDNLAIKLNGQTFSLKLDSSGTYNSLVQSSDGLRISDSLASVISTNTSNIGVLSGVTENLTSSIDSLSTVISSLSGITDGLYSDIESLSSALSEEISNTTSNINSISGALSSEISNTTSNIISLSSALSIEVSSTNADINSLSTSISSEISDRISSDISIVTVINNLSGVTEQTAGSGLTYISSDKSLNVNVDNFTTKINSDNVVAHNLYIQYAAALNTITGTTSGYTGLYLDYNPSSFISAYVNGIEYLINHNSSSPTTDCPFFFNSTPPSIGSELWFDPLTAEFGLDYNTDILTVKYLTLDIV